jgi:hypothetical protein
MKRVVIVVGVVVLALLLMALVVVGIVFAFLDRRGIDWSEFVPNTISGLFTGAVVAVVIGLILSRRESNEAKLARANKAWARWTAMRARVANAMPTDFRFDLAQMADFTSQPGELLAIVDSDTAAELVEDLTDPIERGMLASLANAIASGPELRRRGAELEQRIRGALQSAGVPYDFVLDHSRVATAVVLGNVDDRLSAVTGFSDVQLARMLPPARAALDAVDATAFASFARQYGENWNSLREFARI